MRDLSASPSNCPICGNGRSVSFTARVLRRYDARYLFCSSCGLLQAESPYWLEEAYQSAIAAADTGLLYRNYSCMRRVAPLLYLLGMRDERFLDFAGGYGIFTRLMRDVGFDFYWFDPYCENLLARGFEREKSRPPFAAATAFEVLEHVADPLAFLRAMISETGCLTIIFSTLLFQGEPPARTWWYYVFETGQHISFYQERTLRVMAESLGMYLYTTPDFHVMSKQKIPRGIFRMITSRFSKIALAYVRRRMTPLTVRDHEWLLGSTVSEKVASNHE